MPNQRISEVPPRVQFLNLLRRKWKFDLKVALVAQALAFALFIWFCSDKILNCIGRPIVTFFQLTFLCAIALPTLCITATTLNRINRLQDEVDWIFEFENRITDEQRQALGDEVALASKKVHERTLNMVRKKSSIKLEKAIPAISDYSSTLFEKSDQRRANILPKLISSQRRRAKVRFIFRSMQSKPLNPLVFTFFFTGPLILYFFQGNGFYNLLPWTLLIIAEVLGIKFIDRALWKRGVKFPVPRFWLTFVATLALLSLTILKFPTVQHGPMTSWRHLIPIAVSAYDFTFLSVLGAMVQVGLSDIDPSATTQFIKISKRAVAKYAKSKYLAQHSRRCADLVHRKVQAILIKGAFESRGLAGNQYQEFLSNILNEIDLLFRRELRVNNDSTPSFRESLFNLASHWESLITVTIAEQQLESIVIPVEQELTIYSVIEDALVNAHRHGGATQMWIDFSQISEGNLRLRMRNNGNPVIEQSAGLGSLNFKTATANSWSLRNDGDSVLLEAIFRSS